MEPLAFASWAAAKKIDQIGKLSGSEGLLEALRHQRPTGAAENLDGTPWDRRHPPFGKGQLHGRGCLSADEPREGLPILRHHRH